MNLIVKLEGNQVVVHCNGSRWLAISKRGKELVVDTSACLPTDGHAAEQVARAYVEAFALAKSCFHNKMDHANTQPKIN